MLLCGLVCAVLALVVSMILPDRHTAEAVAVVPSGGKNGLTPGEASNLATTYANLIPEDRAILQSTAARLGLDPVTVRSNLLVTHDFDTSILRVFFSDHDPAVALRGSRAIAQSIGGPNPVSPRITPNSISVVAMPRTTRSEGLQPLTAALLGFVLGLVGGSLLMIAWERADARIRDLKSLSTEVGCPASSLRRASDDSIIALLDRWADIGGTIPLRVALLAATTAAESGCDRAARRLVQVAPHAQRRVARIGDPEAQMDPHVLLDVGGEIGGPAAGERLARTANLIVLVVADETSLDDLRDALDVLDQFGARPDWALYVDRSDEAIPRMIAVPDYASEPRSSTPSPELPDQSPQLPERWIPVGTPTREQAPARRAGAE